MADVIKVTNQLTNQIDYWSFGASLVVQSVKESACSAGDPGSIPRLEEPLEKEMATHSSILACRIHSCL